MMETLTKISIEKILTDFREQLKGIVGDKYIKLMLFGSYSRGEQETGSDIDLILILNRDLTDEEDEMISNLSSELSLKYDVVITCFPYLTDEFEKGNSPFLLNVKKEAMVV